MSPTPSRYSTAPMLRFQFLMLRAVEGGASMSEASDEALGWGVRHPDNDLFEHRPYAAWEAGRHDADHEHDAGDAHHEDHEDHKNHQDHHQDRRATKSTNEDHENDEALSAEPEAVDASWT